MRYGELFAGVSGLGRAVEAVFDADPAWFAEIDAAPSKVLEYHYPGVPNVGDVSAVDWAAPELAVDILAGGFPCQDVSLAGRRKGMRSGTRSGLWAEFARAIEAVRPSWVVIENVRGLLSADGEEPHEDLLNAEAQVDRLRVLSHMADRFIHENPARRREGKSPHGIKWRGIAVRVDRSLKRAIRVRDGERRLVRRAIDTVLRDLADLGFDAEWVSIRASDVGAPHGRFRVFILAWPAENTGHGFGRQAQPGTGGRDDAACGSDRGGSGSGHDSRVTLLPSPRAADGPKGAVTRTAATDLRHASGRANLPEAILTLLPTPVVNDMGDGKTVERWDEWTADMQAKHGNGNGHGRSLAIEASRLLPTPRTTDMNGPGSHGTGGDDLRTTVAMMPTPRATRGGSATEIAYGLGGKRADDERPQGEVLLPTPTVGNATGGNAARSGERADERLLPGLARDHATDWGPYAAAVARWESVLGRPAPSPVRMDGKGGKPRLNPELTEWMMGWPEGWVTAPEIGLSRAEQLKACGNGVVTVQAATALHHLLARPGVPAVAGTFLGRTA